MKFSIVIPTHYQYRYLLTCTLESLNNQPGYSSKDYEVIVVDNGSPTKIEPFILGINKNYILHYIYLPDDGNSSRSRARNVGWQAGSGEFIIFLDSDIIVFHDYLYQLDRYFSAKFDSMVIGNRLLLTDAVSRESVRDQSIFKLYPFDPKNFERLEFRYFFYALSSYNANAIKYPWTMVYGFNLAVPKNWVRKVHGFDENFKTWGMEDLEFGYALYSSGLPIFINSRLEVLHQNHGPRNDLVIHLEKCDGYEANIDFFLKKHPKSLKMRRKVAYDFLKGNFFKKSLALKSSNIKTEKLLLLNEKYLEQIKDQLLILSQTGDRVLVVEDFVETTDLDIWIQSLGITKNTIKYFPASKCLHWDSMIKFFKEARN